MEPERIFVYGTLRPGLEPRLLVPLMKRLGEATEASVSGMLFDFGPYPGAVLDPSVLVDPELGSPRYDRFDAIWRTVRRRHEDSVPEPRVLGLLFDLPSDPEVLKTFDEYEGYDAAEERGEFERVLVNVTTSSGDARSAWVYGITSLPASARFIADGDYPHR